MERRSGYGVVQPGRSWSSSVRAELGLEPQVTRCPSPQRRHVGLGPGLVDEDQTLRLDAVLILAPLRPPVRDVGAIAFAGHHGFFEAQPLGVNEVPDRPIIDLEAALGEFGGKSAQGEVPWLGALRQPRCEVSSSADADAQQARPSGRSQRTHRAAHVAC